MYLINMKFQKTARSAILAFVIVASATIISLREMPTAYAAPGILFPDGQNVTIAWRHRETLIHVAQPYGQHYASLRKRALAGDADAAFSLFSILDACKDAYDNQVDVTFAYDRLQATHMIKLPTWEKELRLLNDDNGKYLEFLISSLQSNFDNCKPITAEQKAESQIWLRQAAYGESSSAALWYAGEVADHHESIQLAEKSWLAGNPAALQFLGKKYMENYDRGDVPTDKIRAYGSYYANVQLLQNLQTETAFDLSAMIRISESKLEAASSKMNMNEREIGEAILFAKALLQSNPNCCEMN